jgi:hypothetical protein
MKPSFPKIKEMKNGMIHLEPPRGADQVTLCGITDWLGDEPGKIGIASAVTCNSCRAIAEYCQAHRRMPKPKRRALSTIGQPKP